MTILALDIASLTGWCLNNNFYGTWDLKTRKDESMGMKLIRFKSKLKEIHNLESLDLIVYERPAGRHANSVIHQAKLIGILEEFCEQSGIQYSASSASEIKKFATGKGNASKDEMIQAAKDKYGYDGSDDNEADAIHLWNLTKDKLL
jgi:Holliday junction resolvasome RuvABC endonuclease subunit